MSRARLLAVIVLLLSYGAVGARQPAVRSSVPLPVPARALADAAGLPVADRSRIVLDLIRLICDAPDGADAKDVELRSRVLSTLQPSAGQEPGETVPLPLDPSIWRESILRRDVPDSQLVVAILSDRQTSLLYHGLASLDDETLGWLGPERDLLASLLEHAGPFATTARSLRVKGGRVLVPGGADAELLWERVVGAEPAKPAAFARRLFGAHEGRIAYLYDLIAHLDDARQRFALAQGQKADAREDRLAALADVFEESFGELRLQDRPFSRQPFDPAFSLATLRVRPDGTLVGPATREFWEIAFKQDDEFDTTFDAVTSDEFRRRQAGAAADAAWLAGRVHRNAARTGRRRLDAILFAQRIFPTPIEDQRAAMATAVRGMLAYPALMLTLERIGIDSPQALADATTRVTVLNGIGDDRRRTLAIRLFQSSLAIIERAQASGGLRREAAASLVASLLALDYSRDASLANFPNWISAHLLRAVGRTEETGAEQTLLAAIAGANQVTARVPVVDWEGRQYQLNPALGELHRLREIRQRQQGPSLDDVLGESENANGRTTALADVLTSIVYAVYFRDLDDRALAGGNVALRHDLGTVQTSGVRALAAWRFAAELIDPNQGWRLRGSLLGLEVPLARFALRRLDTTTMPPAPKLTAPERQTASLTLALLRTNTISDEGRDEIANAVKRGQARFDALSANRDELEAVARDAGLSEWRREALGWSLTHDRENVDAQISLLELMWLGAPRNAERVGLDAWGAASTPLSGCLCLEMPTPRDWETLGGRPSVGVLATRGADVAVLIARELSERHLPAALAPGIAAFAMQDVLDGTQPAYFDDWSQFGRAARSIPEDRIVDYIAALTAGGPLVPAPGPNGGKRP
jgi:hypothetical protein